ncbi:MAG: hypothetical protein ACLQD8_09155 [Thermoplasmata archaeon]
MLRTERSELVTDSGGMSQGHSGARQLLLAVAPPPRPHHAYALSGWPSWLIPAYRAGGHRPSIRLLEER